MDEADIIRDVLERIDKLTQHIIDIKATMYRQADFKMDAARMYDHIGSIQTLMGAAVKDAVNAMESQITTIKESLATHDKQIVIAGRRLPAWTVVFFTAIGTIAVQQVFVFAEAALHIKSSVTP